MENVSHMSIQPNLYFYTDTRVLNHEKFLRRAMIITEDARFEQAYHDWINKWREIQWGSHGGALFFPAALTLPHFASQQARHWREGFRAYVLRTIM